MRVSERRLLHSAGASQFRDDDAARLNIFGFAFRYNFKLDVPSTLLANADEVIGLGCYLVLLRVYEPVAIEIRLHRGHWTYRPPSKPSAPFFRHRETLRRDLTTIQAPPRLPKVLGET